MRGCSIFRTGLLASALLASTSASLRLSCRSRPKLTALVNTRTASGPIIVRPPHAARDGSLRPCPRSVTFSVTIRKQLPRKVAEVRVIRAKRVFAALSELSG